MKINLNRWGWPLATLLMASMSALPIALIGWAVLTPTLEVWSHLWQTRLGELLSNTIFLMIGVGIGTLVLGTGLAWLVSVYQFPGRSVFEWLLILPLAMPGYVMAFVVLSLFNYTGPIQTAFRGWFGSDVWFPNIQSGFGVFIVMSLVLYPYVYLLARAAFLEQGASLIDAARSLGHSRMGAFFKVVLPMARPSIAVGAALAVMESIADVGAVSVLGFPTLSSGIYRVWLGLGEEKAALELAGVLLIFALGLLLLERRLRGRARFYQDSGHTLQSQPVVLKGWRRWGAFSVCLGVISLAFGVPFTQLSIWAWGQINNGALETRYLEFTATTLSLAAVTSLLAVFIALLLAYGKRLNQGRVVGSSVQVSAMGYAIPGAVIGIGIIVAIVSAQDVLNSVYRFFSSQNSVPILTGSIMALVYAYLVRFMAVAFRPVEASLEKVTPSMDMASRNLGKSPVATLRLIHAPLIGVGILTGAILVFVDVMKEQPATLLLRPIGQDTLATRVWQLTTESLWEAAALPALTIVVAGIIPVIFLIRASRQNRYLSLSSRSRTKS